MKRWYNIDLINDADIISFRMFLRDNGIKYETSGNYNMTHFEIYCDAEMAVKIDDYINSI